MNDIIGKLAKELLISLRNCGVFDENTTYDDVVNDGRLGAILLGTFRSCLPDIVGTSAYGNFVLEGIPYNIIDDFTLFQLTPTQINYIFFFKKH